MGGKESNCFLAGSIGKLWLRTYPSIEEGM
jgi:hypothetical protein